MNGNWWSRDIDDGMTASFAKAASRGRFSLVVKPHGPEMQPYRLSFVIRAIPVQARPWTLTRGCSAAALVEAPLADAATPVVRRQGPMLRGDVLYELGTRAAAACLAEYRSVRSGIESSVRQVSHLGAEYAGVDFEAAVTQSVQHSSENRRPPCARASMPSLSGRRRRFRSCRPGMFVELRASVGGAVE